MTVTRRSNGFQVYVARGTSRWRKTVSSQGEAKALEAEWRADLLNGREPAMNEEEKQKGIHEKTFGWWAVRTYDLYWCGSKSAKTAKVNITDVVDTLGEDTPISSIDQSVINDLLTTLKGRGLAPATINRKMAALGKVLTLALEEGGIDRKPKIGRLKEDNRRTKFFNKGELSTLFHHMEAMGHKDIANFCRFLLETGLRVSEALRLEWDDFLEDDTAVLIRKSKNEEPRVIPLSNDAYAAWISGLTCIVVGTDGRAVDTAGKKAPVGKPWKNITQSRLTYCWNKAKDAAGMSDDPECVPHSLRHTCASRLARSGVDILLIKKWLGHKTLAMTMRYSHLSQDRLTSAKDALDAWDEEGSAHE